MQLDNGNRPFAASTQQPHPAIGQMPLNHAMIDAAINPVKDTVEKTRLRRAACTNKKAAPCPGQNGLAGQVAASFVIWRVHRASLNRGDYFFNASRISVSRSTSVGPAWATLVCKTLFTQRTSMKITKAKITKLMIAVMNAP